MPCLSVFLEGLEAAQGYSVSVLFRFKEGLASRSSEGTIIPQLRKTGALRWKEGKGFLNVWTWKWWGPVCEETQMGRGCATHFSRQGQKRGREEGMERREEEETGRREGARVHNQRIPYAKARHTCLPL